MRRWRRRQLRRRMNALGQAAARLQRSMHALDEAARRAQVRAGL